MKARSLGDLIIRLCDLGFGTIESARRCLGRPRVETISTAELECVLKREDWSVTLVDVRSRAEQSVSRIPGAVTQTEIDADPSTLLNKQVVVYCTVGGRSYLYARKLVSMDVDAKNYRDGILGWCRAELPLETPSGDTTHAVHPYWRIFKVPDQYDVTT